MKNILIVEGNLREGKSKFFKSWDTNSYRKFKR